MPTVRLAAAETGVSHRADLRLRHLFAPMPFITQEGDSAKLTKQMLVVRDLGMSTRADLRVQFTPKNRIRTDFPAVTEMRNWGRRSQLAPAATG